MFLLTQSISYKEIVLCGKNPALVFYIVPMLGLGAFFSINYFTCAIELIVNGRTYFPIGITADFLSALVISPICEEVVYRALILTYFLKMYSTSRAIVLNAVLFSFFHFLPTLDLYTLISPFCGGLLLSWLFMKTKNLLIPILVHSCFNGLIIAYPYRRSFIFKFSDAISIMELVTALTLGLIFLILSIRIINRNR